MQIKFNNNYPGQVLLITLLVLSIATTIALSLVARSTVDLNMSTQIEESSRAFSAAEAGIEQSLLNMSAPAGTVTLSSGASFTVNPSNIGGDAAPIIFDSITKVGNSETIWLIGHSGTDLNLSSSSYTNNNINVCWTHGAIIVSIYYITSSSNYRVVKVAFDSNTSRTGSMGEDNQFDGYNSIGNCGTGSGSYYMRNISFSDYGINPASDKLIFMQIRAVYNDTNIVVDPSAVLPLQGFIFNSCGSTADGTTRCINVHERYRAISSLFDHVLYSNNGGITK